MSLHKDAGSCDGISSSSLIRTYHEPSKLAGPPKTIEHDRQVQINNGNVPSFFDKTSRGKKKFGTTQCSYTKPLQYHLHRRTAKTMRCEKKNDNRALGNPGEKKITLVPEISALKYKDERQ